MPNQVAPLTSPRIGLVSASGVLVEARADGALTRFEVDGLSLLLHPATVAEAGPANVHLRRHDEGRTASVPLLGPAAPSRVTATDAAWLAVGTWQGLSYQLTLRLADGLAAWTWSLEVRNDHDAPVLVDAVLTHDPALAAPGAVRTNEYYVSQYLDITPVTTADHGIAIAVRQNMPGPRSPWMAVACLGAGRGWATDASQLVSRSTDGVRWSGLERAELPSVRWQHEHALVALQSEPTELAPGAALSTGFVGVVRAHHPAATGHEDATWLSGVVARLADEATGEHEADAGSSGPAVPSAQSGVAAHLARADALACRPLTDEEVRDLGLLAWPGTTESGPDGVPATWRTDRGEVVTAAREVAVLRPHGQILRTGDGLRPDPGSLTSTVWMTGTFHSQVTRGHVGRDALISGRRTYLGLFRGHGLRLSIGSEDDGWRLLDAPSAWCVGLDACWWWYATDDGLLLEVVARAPSQDHVLGLEVRVVAGPPVGIRATLHLEQMATDLRTDGPHAATLDGWRLAWDATADLTLDQEWLVLEVGATIDWGLSLSAATPGSESTHGYSPGADFWPDVVGAVTLDLEGHAPEAEQVTAISLAAPWFAHNALVHYLGPRGLEQFSGGGWGTRDVCQGPVGLLTALDRHDEVADVLLRVFAAQNERGDWPQAFEFLPPLDDAGQRDAHGDVVYWPLLALGEHLQATGDAGLLAVEVPFVGDDGPTRPAPLEEHVAQAVRRVEAMAVPGTALPAYGHGDWNDSLQPADPALAQRLVSTWTAVLQVQALEALSAGLDAARAAPAVASVAAALAGRTRAAITGSVLLDGVLPGYQLHDGASSDTEPLVHPRDTRTGLTYGLLPWVHAVAGDVLDPEASRHHLALVEQHLLGPDGARLFDRPVTYSGGPMSVFQRAEASTFWGREIGLMYVHAHLRYAEALARVGDGAGLLRALALTSPWGLTERVPQSRPRQRSCYYSSSDGVFADRYDASERYADLMAGGVPLEGGWRIYSSGPGLALRLVVERLLGVRRRADLVEIDPVLPPGCDGLRAGVRIAGHSAEIRYHVGPGGAGVRRVLADGRPLALVDLHNPHRRPGVAVRTDDLRAALAADALLDVETC